MNATLACFVFFLLFTNQKLILKRLTYNFLFEDKQTSKELNNEFGITSRIDGNFQNTNVNTKNLGDTKNDNKPGMSVRAKVENSSKRQTTKLEANASNELEKNESIDTLLEDVLKAEVSDREYADCTMMDFAGHTEFYSTHQTFLTDNAIYLVVFNFNDENIFAEAVDETGLLIVMLTFHIDTI